MKALTLVKLRELMELTSGSCDIRIGLIDGPVVMSHTDLTRASIHDISDKLSGQCINASSLACKHGTFIAGILNGKRGSAAPAICPKCTLLVRTIFSDTPPKNVYIPSATSEELAEAIFETIEAGGRVLNLSIALVKSTKGERALEEVLHYAIKRGVIIVVAAGNQGVINSSTITRHPWVIPVVAYDFGGNPMGESNLGRSLGRRGLGAPGKDITSLGTEGKPITMRGTSVATPFVTGTIALLWSEFPTASASEIRDAVTQSFYQRRRTIVPPLLNAWAAYQMMLTTHPKRHSL